MEKPPRELPPKGLQFCKRSNIPTLVLKGDSLTVVGFVSGWYTCRECHGARVRELQQTLHSWWWQENVQPTKSMGHFAQTPFREHH